MSFSRACVNTHGLFPKEVFLLHTSFPSRGPQASVQAARSLASESFGAESMDHSDSFNLFSGAIERKAGMSMLQTVWARSGTEIRTARTEGRSFSH